MKFTIEIDEDGEATVLRENGSTFCVLPVVLATQMIWEEWDNRNVVRDPSGMSKADYEVVGSSVIDDEMRGAG